MNADHWVAIASVGAVVVSAIAVVVSLRGVNDQLRTATFLAYTERYSTIMGRLPYEARRPSSGYRLESAPHEERIAVLGVFRDYFNLCSEELWLRSIGRIDRRTWAIWVEGMGQVTLFPAFREAWKELSEEYEPYTPFKKFMNELVDRQSSKLKA